MNLLGILGIAIPVVILGTGEISDKALAEVRAKLAPMSHRQRIEFLQEEINKIKSLICPPVGTSRSEVEARFGVGKMQSHSIDPRAPVDPDYVSYNLTPNSNLLISYKANLVDRADIVFKDMVKNRPLVADRAVFEKQEEEDFVGIYLDDQELLSSWNKKHPPK
jgi:hypothetical protein